MIQIKLRSFDLVLSGCSLGRQVRTRVEVVGTHMRKSSKWSTDPDAERQREDLDWKKGEEAMVNKGGHELLEILNVRVIGEGDKPVVLSHGLGTDQSAWQRMVPYLTRDYRVVLYDLACAGSVDPDHFDFQRYATLDGFVDDLFDILDALGIESCAFIGHSISAMAGILAAARRPQQFSKLVLLGASPRYINDTDYDGGFEGDDLEAVYEAMHENYYDWVMGFAPRLVGVDMPEAVQEFCRTLFNMRPDISLFVTRMVARSDVRGILGMVSTPCCIIQGVKDSSVPISVAAYFEAHLGGRTTVELLQAEGHLPHLSAPAVLAPILRRALSQP
ncbi:alpha/beta-Hydrolases superfamily protein [Wolffia australiana]